MTRDECPDCGDSIEPTREEHECMPTPEDIGDGILTTKSVNSTVFDPDSDVDFADVHNGDGDPMGHIALVDFDDTSERQAIARMDNKPGISIILRSSENSHHVWNLCVDDLKTTACRLMLMRDDYGHVRSGIRRNYWRLRFGPKVREGGDTYKEPPQLVTITVNETDYPQSLGHWRLARALWDLPELPPGHDFEWVGESASVERYLTMTDELKEEWADGG